jgi:hypothetical protein
MPPRTPPEWLLRKFGVSRLFPALISSLARPPSMLESANPPLDSAKSSTKDLSHPKAEIMIDHVNL